MQARNRRSRLKTIFNNILLATNIVVLLLLLCTKWSWSTSPLNNAIFAYIGIAFPIILSINACYIVLWIFLKKWSYLLICLSFMIVCHKQILTYCPLNISSGTIPDNSIKVMSYNVMWFISESKHNNYPILNYIKEQNPDIVCIQEYCTEKFNSNNIKQKDIDNFMKQYPYRCITPLSTYGENSIYGFACFSKYPVEESKVFKTKNSVNGAVVYNVTVGGKNITVANCHLESNRITDQDKHLYNSLLTNRNKETLTAVTKNMRERLSLGFRARAKQVEPIKEYISQLKSDATIVCGDFNDTPISYAYNTIRGKLKDSYTSCGFGPGITYNRLPFLFRIDYILHSNNIKANKTTVGKVKYSDHYPVWTHLSFYD